MSKLTDRYVAATLRSVPEKSRADIERELRASIADALDARLERGESPDAAEVAALTELGDPSRLAAEYSGPPRYLIGPNVYPSYIRTLGLVLAFCVPTSGSALLALWVAGGASLPTAVLTAVVGVLFVALFVAFWVTFAFAVVDRSAEARAEMKAAFGVAGGTWTPDRLPATASLKPVRANEAIEAIVGGAIGVALIFMQRSVSPFNDASGNPIPFLNPNLWSFWMPIALAIFVAWILAEFAMLALGKWSPAIAILISAMALASGTLYIYLLASGQLFNSAFFEKLGAAPWVAPGSISVIALILLSAVDTCTRIARLWGAPIGRGRRRS